MRLRQERWAGIRIHGSRVSSSIDRTRVGSRWGLASVGGMGGRIH